MRKPLLLIVALSAVLALALPAGATTAPPREPSKDPVAVGRGGAVSTVDPTATRAGLDVLRKGGNAVDAAVAAAATLGVTEPYSSGIGGGGFMLIYLADTAEVVTIDGREEAPDDHRFDADVFTENTVSLGVAREAGPAGYVSAVRDDPREHWPLHACLALDLSPGLPAPTWPTRLWLDQEPVRLLA